VPLPACLVHVPPRLEVNLTAAEQQTITGMLDAIDEMLHLKRTRIGRLEFCRVCGSPIVRKFDAHPKYLGLPLGALDDDPGIRPKVHMHVASKAPWFTITDGLPQIPGEASASADN
jgi:hypothetical protein